MRYSPRKRTFNRYVLTIGLLSVCASCSHSSSGIERSIVTGKVTYQGKPVERGDIQFVPESGTVGPSSGALIENGSYTIDLRGGVPVGKHRVVIFGHRRKPGSAPFTDDGPGMVKGEYPLEQFLPAKFNNRTELTVTIEARRNQRCDFHLKSG